MDPLLLRVPYRAVVTLTSIVPAVALMSCAAVGMCQHWEKLLRTHCNVHNVLPSVSAMIGHYLLESFIWRLAMATVCFPKLLDGYLYYHFFHAHQDSRSGPSFMFCWLNKLTCTLYYCQWVLFLTVSYVSAKEHNACHLYSFFLWLVVSTVHMALFIVLYEKCSTPQKASALTIRRLLWMAQVVAVVGFAYFAYRHNTFCEPYIYSYLAVCEYVLGVTFTCFHAVAAIDFKHYYFAICI